VAAPAAPATAQQPPQEGEIDNAATLKQQQIQAQEALTRAATMAKLNDTLRFTDGTTSALEKTPQQVMADEANRQLAAKASSQSNPANGVAVASMSPPPVKSAEATTSPLAAQSAPVARYIGDAGSRGGAQPAVTDDRLKAVRSALNF